MAKNPDPREVGPKPPFPEQPQSHPGSVRQLTPKADHGEESYTGTGKLQGQVAIVTGADSGIGRAVAIAFAKEGANVVLSYLPEEEADAREVVRELDPFAGTEAGCATDSGIRLRALARVVRHPRECNTPLASLARNGLLESPALGSSGWPQARRRSS